MNSIKRTSHDTGVVDYLPLDDVVDGLCNRVEEADGLAFLLLVGEVLSDSLYEYELVGGAAETAPAEFIAYIWDYPDEFIPRD